MQSSGTGLSILEALASGRGGSWRDSTVRESSIRAGLRQERLDDLPVLVSHFTTLAAREVGKKKFIIPRELYSLLENYSFPGNIRELQAMVFDAVSRQQGNVLGLHAFVELMGLGKG